MARALKILIFIVFGLILLAAGAILAVTRLIDPNDFKPQISTLAHEQAGLDVSIPGNLAWSFWPYLGIEIGRTEVRLAGDEDLFAAFDSVQTSVAVLPLLRGSVALSGLYLDGLELNLLETADGANWERIGGTGADTGETPVDPANSATGLDIPVTIPELRLGNGRVRYRSTLDGSDIQIEQLSLSATDVSLTSPFPLEASLRYQDQDDLRIDLALSGRLGMDLERNLFRFEQSVADVSLAGLTSLPVQVLARQSIEAALDEDRISIRDLVLEAAGTRTHGALEITALSTKPVFRGQLSVDPFDANAALRTIGEAPIATTDPQALKRVAMEMTFSGPENSILLEPLIIRLDDSSIRGVAGLTDIDSGHIRFDLTLDSLIADGYLPPAEETTTDDTALASTETLLPPLSSEPLLPLDTLRELKVDGAFSAGRISVEGIELRDLRLLARADAGLLELVELTSQLMDGTLRAEAALDARTDTPQLRASASTQSVQIQPIMQMALDDDLFTGILDMNFSFNASGNSEQALADSGKGTMNMTLAKGTIRGMNLNNALGAGINDMLGQYQVITQFLPDVDQGRLPPALKEDTEVVQLKAVTRIENLVAHVDDLQAELDRGTLSGKGFLNLRSQAFDLRLAMKVPELSTNKYIADRSWPMRCKGNLAGDVTKWCGADSKAFRDIGKDITTQLAKDKLLDRFGIEGQGDSAEAVVKDAAKQKAKEEVKKKAEEGLRRLLQ